MSYFILWTGVRTESKTDAKKYYNYINRYKPLNSVDM